MTDTSIQPPGAGPARRERIETLDVLRGLAIFGIFFVNIPFMASAAWTEGGESASMGDELVSWIGDLVLEGTQRGILEMLFGAGMVLLTAIAMRADGPIGVADTFFRRNLWLLAFGLLHVFLVQWPYDILHVYALAALFLFPFRLLSPARACGIGLSFALLTSMGGAVGMSGGYGPDLATGGGAMMFDSTNAGGAIALWLAEVEGLGLWRSIAEALCTMLIGVALFKWGVIQGLRSRGFYLALAVSSYGAGFALRLLETGDEVFAGPLDTSELSRLAVTLGHIALVNLAWQSGAGRWLLWPFRAAGRTAFSLYVMQSLIGIWVLFAPWGTLHGADLGPAGLAAVVVLLAGAQLLTANLWLRRFGSGPLEWLWRRLTDGRWHGGRSARRAANASL